MNKNILYIILIIFTQYSKAQTLIKGKILDNSQTPISYATIKSENGEIYFSDSLGNFNLSIDSKNSTFIFGCVGFENKSFTFNLITDYVIINLSRISYKLAEVTVNSKKVKLKTIEIGNKKTGYTKEISKVGFQSAIYIPNNEKILGTIKSVSYFIRKPPEGSYSGSFRVRLYELDTISNKPGKDLLLENLIVNASKNSSWFEVDLLKYNINLPDNGFFIAFEITPNNNFQSNNKINSKKLIDKKGLPAIGITFGKKGYSSWMYFIDNNSKNGIWSKNNSYKYSIKTKIIKEDSFK
jgi:hypothetical protein